MDTQTMSHFGAPQPVKLPDTQRQDRVLERPRFWIRYRTRLILALIVLTLLGSLAWSLLRVSGTLTSVDRSRLTFAAVQRGSFVRDIAAEGQVVAAVSPTLYAPAAGSVTLKVNAGDQVHEGQTLAVIDSPDLSARLSQEEATLANLRIDWGRARLDAAQKLRQLRTTFNQAELDQKTAQRELDRSRKAFELGSYSELHVLRAQDELEKARFAFEQAKMNYDAQPEQNRFDVEGKKALLDRQQFLVAELHRQVDALNIRSPVTGDVGRVIIEDRATVAKDAQLLTVVDLSALEVEIKVPEMLARDLKNGMTADLDAGGRHWKATVSAVAPQVVNGEVVARLRFADHSPVGFRQNQRLSVRILIDTRNDVLMVDRGPFLEQEGGFVYVVHDNVAERHAVRIGATSVQKVEIAAGLVEGDQIVIAGTDAFHSAPRVVLSH